MKYEIRANEEFKSVEIVFDGKPSEAIREKLKENGFRWHGVRRLWYGYKTAEETAEILQATENASTDETPERTAESDGRTGSKQARENRERLKKEYIDTLCDTIWRNDDGMKKHFNETIAEVVELTDGSLIPIEKSRMKTSFCFGYGYSGVSTQEQSDEADDMADYARKNGEYFINENLRRFAWQYEALKEEPETLYACVTYNGLPKDSKIKSLRNIREIKDYYGKAKNETASPLSTDDINALTEAYERERNAFIKRLNTYLKRYGTEKLNVWTYLSD